MNIHVLVPPSSIQIDSTLVTEVNPVEPLEEIDPMVIPLTQFVAEFGNGLLDAVRSQNPPVFDGQSNVSRSAVLSGLSRQAFPAQADVVQAVAALLIDRAKPSAIINAEMGTGKTMMAIAVAAVLHHENIKRSLVVCPPHLVYKWRREILKTVPNAKVWILNGPDTLVKLLQLRLVKFKPESPEFFVMGRVRMRMGFSWKPAFQTRFGYSDSNEMVRDRLACCPKCGSFVMDTSGVEPMRLDVNDATLFLNQRRMSCTSKGCGERLWSLVRPGAAIRNESDMLLDAMTQIPTIGPKTAEKLVQRFGSSMLSGMLGDNVHEFINLMDDQGDLFFSDRQAKRMERAMASMEFTFGQGGFQPTEFIKRYLPSNFFGLLIADEGHEFKNEHSAQGQAFGVLAAKCRKKIGRAHV